MDAQTLCRLFDQHVSETGMIPGSTTPGRNPAVIFAEGEFRLDWSRRMVTLPLLGEVPITDDSARPESLDWVAVIPGESGIDVVLGNGDPFDPGHGDTFRRIGNLVFAVPYSYDPVE